MATASETSFETARANMVNGQVTPNQVNDRRVIAAMRTLPREAFAPIPALAYSDAELDLGQGRFMPSPMVTARLAQLVLSFEPAHILVVGAGPGYLAAVLASCGPHVVALEEERRLDKGALGAHAPKAERVTGPLAAGWPAGGPYDVILIEGAVPSIPPAFAAQLIPGGRVVAMIGGGTQAGLARVCVGEVTGAKFSTVPAFDCMAKPLPQFRLAPAFSF